jgi:hypothetical protein
MATTHHHRVADLDCRARRAAAYSEAVLGPPGGSYPARLDSRPAPIACHRRAPRMRSPTRRMARVRGVDFERSYCLAEWARAVTYMTPTPSRKLKPDRH